LAWIRLQAQEFQVSIKERRDLAIIAIQGPNARSKVNQVLSPTQQQAIKDLTLFQGVESEDFWIARTGYTGEDGYEILLPNDKVPTFWRDLLKVGVTPCGLGARDTLRLEAGLNLYGADMDETTTPLEANLEWTIAWMPEDRHFIGRVALTQQKQAGIKQILTGLLFTGRGVLRNHQSVVLPSQGEGEITSGSFSPTLGKSIALARIPNTQATQCEVQIRNQLFPVQIVKPPFVRNGKVLVE
jgi:aminomethyltransferase